jgi:hypothetical protein
MLVSELIEELKKMPQDLNVMLFDHEYWKNYDLKNVQISNEDLDRNKQKIVEIS